MKPSTSCLSSCHGESLESALRTNRLALPTRIGRVLAKTALVFDVFSTEERNAG
jgi:hypothetical protein